MASENIKKYIEDLYSNDNMKILNAKKQLLLISKNDTKVYELYNNIDGKSYNEAMKVFNEFENPVKENASNEELISKAFGINISDIEHKKLNNGKEIFAFYDENYLRKRIIEKPKDNVSLTEYLKEVQNNNIKYQGENDYKQNANSIIKDEANKTKYEKAMVHVDDVYNHEDEIRNLSDDQKKCLKALLKQKEEKHIKYVNIEDCFALDSNGTIIDCYIDKNTYEPVITSSQEFKYNSTEMDNKDEIKSGYEKNYNPETENYNIEFNEFEDEPELEEYDFIDKNISNDERQVIISNIKNYYNNPDSMLTLPDEERIKYEDYVTKYAEKQEKKKQNTNKKVNKLVYNPSNNEYGFTDIILVSLMTIIMLMVVGIFVLITN